MDQVTEHFNQTLAELFKQAKEADKIDKGNADLLQMLIRQPGWTVYIGLLDKRIQIFADEVLKPAGTVDGAVALEYLKGAMSGLIMARDLPSVNIAAASEIVRPKEDEE